MPFQGATPKDLAVQFQKQDCIDFLTSAEVEADIFEYTEGINIDHNYFHSEWS